jgi:ribosomal protein S18 acetylase RimI-like enzyme
MALKPSLHCNNWAKKMYLIVLPSAHNDQEYLNNFALRLKDLRLRSLQTDPEAFSSTYAMENKQPLEFWTKRLQNPAARHFIIARSGSSDEHSDREGDLLSDEWVSLLVVFGPQAIHPDKFENASSWMACLDSNRNLEDVEISEQRSVLMYHIVGVWVAPEARRRGVAKRMVEGAIDTIKQEGQQKRASTAICTIGVQDTAMAAQNLYQACGFSKVAEDCYKGHGGRSIRHFVMRQDIETNAVEAG